MDNSRGVQPYERDVSAKTNTPHIATQTLTDGLKMVSKRKSASAAPPTPASALQQLQQEHELKIISITEPLKPKELPQSSKKRNSAASVDSDQHVDTHPAALEADLLHYKVRVKCGCSRRSVECVYNSAGLTTITGAVQQTTLQLRRTSHQRKVPSQPHRRSTASCRSYRER